ncbi:MAG: thiamine phosphate synthase [Beijerinckiaceae bacterium]|nr:thiamine phosphate synthase [Beijerinckiaceae bacterium]
MIPQFYLLTPPITDVMAFRPKLEPVLATGAVAVLRATFGAAGDPEIKGPATAIRGLVQEAGAAMLIDLPADPRLVARLGIDGVHVAGPGPRLDEAVEALKPDRIVGIGGLKARHDAMEAGERDIDYVMFGEPRPDGTLPAFSQTVERAEWWASIFTVPCVAYAPDLDGVEALTRTGAEFIALGPWLFEAEDPAALLAEARRRVKERSLRPAGA